MSEQSKIDAERAALNDYLNEVVETKQVGALTIKLQRHDEYTVDDEKIAWDAWQARASLPVGVPDGWRLLPDQPNEGMLNQVSPITGKEERLPYWWYRALLAAAPAAPTVKAEQAHDSVEFGFDDRSVRVSQEAYAIFLDRESALRQGIQSLQDQLREMQAQAPSLPAAGSEELTAVRCQCCATEYPHDSYDAGFIAGSGMCQVCDAAMPPKDLPIGEVEIPDIVATFDGLYLVPIQPLQRGEHLMTVAQCIRIQEQLRAALSTQQSAPERVIELLGKATNHLQLHAEESGHPGQYALIAELRALLASHGRGEA